MRGERRWARIRAPAYLDEEELDDLRVGALDDAVRVQLALKDEARVGLAAPRLHYGHDLLVGGQGAADCTRGERSNGVVTLWLRRCSKRARRSLTDGAIKAFVQREAQGVVLRVVEADFLCGQRRWRDECLGRRHPSMPRNINVITLPHLPSPGTRPGPCCVARSARSCTNYPACSTVRAEPAKHVARKQTGASLEDSLTCNTILPFSVFGGAAI